MAQPFNKRQHKPPETTVHVQRYTRLLRQSAQFLNGINHAVWVTRRRTDNKRRVAVNPFTRRRQVHPAGVVHGHVHRLYAEIMGRLFEGDMYSRGHNHLRAAPVGPVPVSLYRQQARFRTARGHCAAHLGVAVKQVGRHTHHLRFEPFETLEGKRVQGILGKIEAMRFFQEAGVFVAQAVNQAPGPAVTPLGVVAAKRLHCLQYFRAVPPGLRNA